MAKTDMKARIRERYMRIAQDTKKEFSFSKDLGKWGWYNRKDEQPVEYKFDTHEEALKDAVEPYFEASLSTVVLMYSDGRSIGTIQTWLDDEELQEKFDSWKRTVDLDVVSIYDFAAWIEYEGYGRIAPVVEICNLK